jgi:thiosulfate/3-mercaptopyruvate sulfurtransferase
MSPLTLPGPLVSAAWVTEQLEHPELVVLDANLQAVTAGAAAGDEAVSQIPGARRFDFDKRICDRASSLPHMMPTAELFTDEVRALGVGTRSVVVVYDRVGVYGSARAWWMFRAMGHDAVAVLDGGLPAWIAAGLPCEPVAARPFVPAGDFVARPRRQLFCDTDAVLAALADGQCAVVDARSPGRFAGREPEPRPGLRLGHMPNAVNLPFGALQDRGRMRAADELASILAAKVGRHKKLIFTCGSGVTSCILALGAELAGYRDLAVYDGSWSEWGMPSSSRPVVTGD